jgi:hypothetical protein
MYAEASQHTCAQSAVSRTQWPLGLLSRKQAAPQSSHD